MRTALSVFLADVCLGACGGDGGARQESLKLTVGDSIPLSGTLAEFGPSGRKAADLAESWIRKAAKAAGVDHTVKVIHADNATNSRAAIEAARGLVADGSQCIAGAWAPSDSVATAKAVSIPEQILQISPASTSATLTRASDDGYLNRLPPADSLQGLALAAAIDDQVGGASGKTVNIAARDDPYGRALSNDFAKSWVARGGNIGEKVLYQTGQPSYNSEAETIASGIPDAFVVIGFTDDFLKLGPALMRTGNWEPGRTFATDGLVSKELLKDPGPDVVGGMHATVPGMPEAGTAAQAFGRLFARSSPRNVGRQTFDAQNFDAVILCYLSAVAAGSTKGEDMKDELRDVSGPPGRKYSWEQLPNAIKALEDGKDIDYEGAAGSFDLDENGDPTDGVYDLVEFTGREIKSIEQVDVAKARAGTKDEKTAE